MKRSLLNIFTFVVGLLFASAAFAQQETSGAKVIDPADMDLTTKPGADFAQYSGGTWMRKNPVPAKETRWGAFSIVRDFNMKAVREILKEAAADKNAPAGSVKKRVGDFYAAAMDSMAAEQAGFKP